MPGEEDYGNAAAVQAIVKSAGASWKAERTSLSELTLEEKQRHLGYTPGPEDPSLEERVAMAAANQAGARSMEAVGAPVAIDWRNINGANYITSVKDQGGCGSCVAFGTVATVEGGIRVARSEATYPIDLSEAHLFYCLARAQGRTCGGASGGWWVGGSNGSMEAFKTTGVVDDPCYPYTAGDQNCTGLCSDWQNRVTKIAGWHAITTVADMKTWLSTNGPLAACFTVYNDFFSYSGGIYHHVTGGVAGGHCVCCVGYNDTDQCWIMKNSWGTNWGESRPNATERGYFRIRYGDSGIDATMWAAEVAMNFWYNNKRIVGLWANEADRNAWAFLDGLGWKKIAPDNDNIFFNLLTLLAAAKTANRPCNIYVQNNIIRQLYVL